jgi:DnaK suppressor protein
VAEEHFAHPEDAPAQVASERDTEFALNEHETAQLGHIATALERLERGTYGACTDCGTTIAAERLRATPQAARCMACQEKAERRGG